MSKSVLEPGLRRRPWLRFQPFWRRRRPQEPSELVRAILADFRQREALLRSWGEHGRAAEVEYLRQMVLVASETYRD